MNWNTYPTEEMPDSLGQSRERVRGIGQTPDGALWLRGSFGHLVRFVPDRNAPETVLEPAVDRVSSTGNILLRWSGNDFWNDTPREDLRYQWRMDGGEWSLASGRPDFTFTSLSSGGHTLEVRAVDRDMNVDATPAAHAFVVEAPWWRNPYVLGAAVVLLGLAGVQNRSRSKTG